VSQTGRSEGGVSPPKKGEEEEKLENWGKGLHWLEKRRVLARLCLWGTGIQRVGAMHTLLESVIPRDRDRIYLIRGIMQRDQQRRFDLYATTEGMKKVRRAVEAWKESSEEQWHVRPHRSYQERNMRRQKSLDGRKGGARGLTIATWNAGWIGAKTDYVATLLDRDSPSILAIQETWRKPGLKPLRLGPYRGVERAADPLCAGSTGLAILVSNRSGLTLVEKRTRRTSPFCIAAKVGGMERTDGSELYIVCTYVPGRGDERKQALQDIVGAVEDIRWDSDGKAGIVILGDWNMRPEKVQKWIQRHLRGAIRAPVPEKAVTWWRRGLKPSQLDHIVYMNLPGPAQCWVNDEWDASDHYPVTGLWRPGKEGKWGVPAPRASPRIDPKRTMTHSQAIVNDNRWLPLLALEDDLDTVAEKFQETAWAVCTDHGATKTGTGGRDRRPPRDIVKAARARQEAYKRARKDPSRENIQAYTEARAGCEQRLREERRAGYLAHRAEYGEALRNADPKTAWAWMKRKYEGARQGGGSTAIEDPRTGKLATDPEQIAQVWAEWFGGLARDASGHGRDPRFWLDKEVKWRDEIEELNRDLTWTEVRGMVARIASGKACGVDGIPGELLKLTKGDAGESPASPMARALYHLLQQCWERERFPATWDKAIVVPVPKKGNMLVTDNYRGISLVTATQKLMSAILADRLMVHVIAAGRVSRAQAGFRTREEAVAQAACLYEILRRRAIKGEDTWLCFVDFCKAYDKVPHEALLRKVEAIGVRGKCLRVIRALYRSPSLCTRNPMGGYSQEVPLECGVRQGDPASPALFNIFIDDLIDEGMREDGIQVGKERIAGLLFADDAVLMAPTAEQLERLLGRLTAWSDRWEFRVNIAKCGIMKVPGGSERENEEEPRGDIPDPTTHGGPSPFRIQGGQVPWVQSYVYLGVEMTPSLELDRMAGQRSTKASGFLAEVAPFLADWRVPLRAKKMVITSCLIPRIMYGAEIWGMSGSRCEGAQRVINRAVRLATGVGKSAPIALVCDDLRILPAHVSASCRRTRMVLKARNLRTYLRAVIEDPFVARKRTWYTGAWTWLKKRSEGPAPENGGGDRARVARLRESMLGQWRQEDKTLARATFDRWRLGETTNAWLLLQGEMPEVAWAVSMILRIRWNGHAWQRTRTSDAGCGAGNAQRGEDPSASARYGLFIGCMACGVEGAEEGSVEHYLLHCPRWNQIRELTLRPTIRRMETEVGRGDGNRDRTIGMMLLGGRRGPTREESESFPHIQTQKGADWTASTAQFVQKTWWGRMRSPIPPRGEAQPGMPIARASTLSIEDQGVT
jgi:exonuclease III